MKHRGRCQLKFKAPKTYSPPPTCPILSWSVIVKNTWIQCNISIHILLKFISFEQHGKIDWIELDWLLDFLGLKNTMQRFEILALTTLDGIQNYHVQPVKLQITFHRNRCGANVTRVQHGRHINLNMNNFNFLEVSFTISDFSWFFKDILIDIIWTQDDFCVFVVRDKVATPRQGKFVLILKPTVIKTSNRSQCIQCILQVGIVNF